MEKKKVIKNASVIEGTSSTENVVKEVVASKAPAKKKAISKVAVKDEPKAIKLNPVIKKRTILQRIGLWFKTKYSKVINWFNS